MKKIFCKIPSRIVSFTEKLPATLLPPCPFLTHCCLFLKAVKYYSKNPEAIKKISQALLNSDAACVPFGRKTAKDVNVKKIAYVRYYIHKRYCIF
jgi:hypothetical protein